MEETTNNSENTFNKEELNSFVKDALLQIKKINELYKKLFDASEGKEAIASEIEKSLEAIKKNHDDLFTNNESGVSKISELNTKLEEIRAFHKELLDADSSIKKDIKESQDKITDFYVYLFGGLEGEEGQEKKLKTAIQDVIKFHEELTNDGGYAKSIEDKHKLILETYNSLYSESESVPSRISKLREDIAGIEFFDKKIKEVIVPMLEDKQKNIEAIESDISTKQAEVSSLLSDATVNLHRLKITLSKGPYGCIREK